MHNSKPPRANINLNLTEQERDALNRAAVALTVREGRPVNVTETLRAALNALCGTLGIAGADGGAQ